MKILHILRNLDDEWAISIIQEHGKENHVGVLLLHDAVLTGIPFEAETFASHDDVEARGGRCKYPTIDYDGIARMLFEYDRVISW